MLKFRQGQKAAIYPCGDQKQFMSSTPLSAKFGATSILQPELVSPGGLQSFPPANELSAMIRAFDRPLMGVSLREGVLVVRLGYWFQRIFTGLKNR
jgi:hypothetical protein